MTSVVTECGSLTIKATEATGGTPGEGLTLTHGVGVVNSDPRSGEAYLHVRPRRTSKHQ